MNKTKIQEQINFISTKNTGPCWYTSPTIFADAVQIAVDERINIDENITFERVMLLDTLGKPIPCTSKKDAIDQANQLGLTAYEVSTRENESLVRLYDLRGDIQITNKLGLLTKDERPWIFDMDKKVGSSISYDAWPRSSKKESKKMGGTKVVYDHPSHKNLHKCRLNLDGQIVGYRLPKIPDKFICLEPVKDIFENFE